MGKRLWLDDVRPMPEGFDLLAKTAQEAQEAIATSEVSFISFDHDLGPEEAGTGYEVACWIEERAYALLIEPPDYEIHSADPVGTRHIQAAMESAKHGWRTKY